MRIWNIYIYIYKICRSVVSSRFIFERIIDWQDCRESAELDL